VGLLKELIPRRAGLLGVELIVAAAQIVTLTLLSLPLHFTSNHHARVVEVISLETLVNEPWVVHESLLLASLDSLANRLTCVLGERVILRDEVFTDSLVGEVDLLLLVLLSDRIR